MFFKGLKEAGGDETKIQTICGALQIFFFIEVGPQGQRQLAAKYTQRRRRPRFNGGWESKPEVVSNVCTDFATSFFERF